MKAWAQRNPTAVMALFAHNGLVYYESALTEPLTESDKIAELWKVVPKNQDNITYTTKLLALQDGIAVVNWRMSRTLLPSGAPQQIDGIFELHFDKQGLCNYFRQWRTVA